jgi:hypothetical protein
MKSITKEVIVKRIALPLIAMLALLGCSSDVVGPQPHGAADEVTPQSQPGVDGVDGVDGDACSENLAEIIEGSVDDAEDLCSLLSP